MLMGNKIIDFNKTIYELSNENPDVVKILAELGFTDIIKPGMISTVGRFMTIKKGSDAKRIDLEVIKKKFEESGYEVNL